jgi:hypothetical protein
MLDYRDPRLNPKIQLLLATDSSTAQAELDRLTPEELLAPARIVSPDDAALVKAGLYLHHGYFAECHRIAQRVERANGAYWHALMHRREGDFENAKHWYRRVGAHPVLQSFGPDWEPCWFVDQCAAGGSAETDALQQHEFDLLLAHTLAGATGATERLRA